jgi:hypothetical protein
MQEKLRTIGYFLSDATQSPQFYTEVRTLPHPLQKEHPFPLCSLALPGTTSRFLGLHKSLIILRFFKDPLPSSCPEPTLGSAPAQRSNPLWALPCL